MQIHTLNMSRTATRAALPETLTAVDADGDDFTLDFGMTALAGKPVATVVETDKVAAALAAETVANHFRAEWYREQGLLP